MKRLTHVIAVALIALGIAAGVARAYPASAGHIPLAAFDAFLEIEGMPSEDP